MNVKRRKIDPSIITTLPSSSNLNKLHDYDPLLEQLNSKKDKEILFALKSIKLVSLLDVTCNLKNLRN